MLGWHLVFTAMIVVVAVATVTAARMTAGRQWLLLGVTLTWVLWYAAFGAPNLMERGSAWRARSYVIGAVCLALGVAWLAPGISWTSFILIPQIFAALSRISEAIIAVAILLIGYGAVLTSQGDVVGSQRWALVFGLLTSFVFAVTIGI